MSKKKEEKDESKEKKTVAKEVPFLQGMCNAAEAKFGEGTYMGREIDKFVQGFTLPSLSLMYLFDSNVFPLSKYIGLAGPPKSNKSTLGYEFLRWICDNNGYGKIVENEAAKISPQLIKSVMGEKHYASRLQLAQSTDISVAQKHMTWTMQYLKQNSDKDVLFGMMLDSLSGTDTAEQAVKVAKEGFSGRNFPSAALSWTAYMKYICPQLVGWPVAFITINHLKEMPSEKGYGTEKRTPGGSAQTYHAAVYLWVRRVGGVEQRKTAIVDGLEVSRNQEVRKIVLENAFSSLGNEGRSIAVDLVWWRENGQQYTYFDWDASTSRLLLALQNEESADAKLIKGLQKGFDRTALRAIVDVNYNNGRFSSKQLGVDKLTASDFGKTVHANADLMTQLISFFQISQHPIFKGLSFAQKKQQRKEAPVKPENISATAHLDAAAVEEAVVAADSTGEPDLGAVSELGPD